MICPEFRHMMAGSERADSFVFNPHKWLGVSFDCSAHFVRDPADLVRTLAIRPSYLETRGAVTNTVTVDAYRGAGKPEANFIVGK